MNVSWVNSFRDRATLIVSLLLLTLPLALYSYSIVVVVRADKLMQATDAANEAVYEAEILLDHINGALISLASLDDSSLDCNEPMLRQMHELSFELIGVEAFYLLGADGQLLCTDWLAAFSTFDASAPARSGIHFSPEVYIPEIGRTGVYVYRVNGRGQYIGSLVASAYFRQVLNQNIPVQDALAFYNRNFEQPVALTGLISSERLVAIRRALETPQETLFEADSQSRIITAHSLQYPRLVAVYLLKKQSVAEILAAHISELVMILLLSLLAMLGWFNFRHQKIHSYRFQLQLALRHSEFEPYFQPIVDMRTGEWLGVEILARWFRAGTSVASPDEFIGKAEKHGLLKALTRQVTTKSIALMEDIVERYPDFYFSINLSPNQMDQVTVDFVVGLLQQNEKIKPCNIRFEITEQGLAEVNKVKFRQTVEQLSAHGIYIGLDDFGAGQSGLEYFSNITPHFLKIDRRFVSAIPHPQSVDYQILKTIVQLAKMLNLTIVAEGIETEQHARWLIDQGIQKGQGWLYHKPMAEAELWAKLSAE
ncbi:EAL domain-containing protein [Reinekea marinisedimentorum]|uniref:EAL domain-containing protein (Putative c-di-GMP-specific phosphodiesterase class I) n=1 Tax=Reinekea marinisedimentorum TaxID=230495 RepID=A0A4R3ICJ0_9GAMM|nr:EAL domain-containing protein [Reinekea marinisedimentorum]TCS43885.1 EAL domain-containing protein (putative c-di-GMP-specific phosphodiesterase class I) [Reinekea marinisedimentorum]